MRGSWRNYTKGAYFALRLSFWALRCHLVAFSGILVSFSGILVSFSGVLVSLWCHFVLPVFVWDGLVGLHVQVG